MKVFRFTSKIRDWLRGGLRSQENAAPIRGVRTHVIILDGTMSSLEEGMETNAGRTYQLLSEKGGISLFYEAGLQFTKWHNAPDIMMGRGINRQIRRAYGVLASRYRPGDRIFLFGYSRGAFAVRSLAGVIDRIGLLQAQHATERNIRQAYRHYETDPNAPVVGEFAKAFCHETVEIQMIGVWDTVKALGVRLPLVWKLSDRQHDFHDHRLGQSVRNGFHALALNETRSVYAPVMWSTENGWQGNVEQVWFRGTHGDVGGQIDGMSDVRPLANIPLVWMLENAERCGLEMPAGWKARFPMDVTAPSIGTWRGWGKLFLARHRRKVGQDASERIHDTVPEKVKRRWRIVPSLLVRRFGFHNNTGG
ncbi:DUF2235 domain-containing protein [Cognatishimia sp. D5M38]|uniref:DUF2235 domain-containing protein n=1 Tax=Cognatishimia coralii TaxID=3083254 RepID=A0ABU8QDJ6_9RHOB